MQPGGIYYGQNAVSKNMLVADRRKLLNGNSFRLGVSGSGKSFSAKEEIVDLALSTEDDILILNPESEFASLVEALNGEVIRISATSDTHLNALDMDSAYGNDRNPLIKKSEFILLNQATTDRDELAALLNISDNQLSYITNVGAGHGLIRCSGNLVPFENSFPRNTKLYRLMTTKPGEA